MDTMQPSEFGGLLREYRRVIGLTQEALAEQSGLSTDAIGLLERGRRHTPQGGTIDLLAKALQLSPQERAAFIASARLPVRPRRTPTIATPDQLRHPEGASALRMPLTPLVGRERDLAAAQALLRQGDVRLLTLVGPPGVGKTRLALAAAEATRDAFPDGVAFVPLADIHDAVRVAATLARTLEVDRDGERSPQRALVDHLRDRHALLVLDNFEQVTAAAPLVVDLCAACPGIVALVTSRTALCVRGEQTFPVPPLALPPPDAPPDAEALGRSAAVRLFVRRVQDVQPDFALAPANAAVVAAICRYLDGLPLAIELAAARTRMLPLPTLLAQLERPQDVLVNGPRDLPARQRTLRAALDWSHDLLDPAAQATFRRLAVFAGDFPTDAAVAVCVAAGDDSETLIPPALYEVIAAIEALVDGNLLAPTEADGAADGGEAALRLRMLATVRAYALDRLRTAGEEARVRRAHADHYLAFAEEAAGALLGPTQATWVARVEQEYDGLRAALQWAWEAQDVGRGLRLVGALWYFWYVRGYLTEGRAWLERALTTAAASAPAVSASAHARACDGAAILAYGQNDYARAAMLFARALPLYEEAGDRGGRAAVLGRMGLVALEQGDYDRAKALAGESLALRRELGDCWGAANALSTLGMIARLHGRYERARELLHESLALKRALGDRWGIAYALNNLGVAACEQGQADRAHALHEEALGLFRDVRGTPGVADALNNLAIIAHGRGDDNRATELAGESLGLRRELGDRRGMAATLRTLARIARDRGDAERAATLYAEILDLLRGSGDHPARAACVEGVAATAWAHGQSECAARLYGRADSVRAAHQTPLPPVERPHQDGVLAALRAALGDGHFRAAWEDGRATPLERVIPATLADIPGRIGPA